MNAPQLPAHLQGRVAQGMAARAAEGMGSALPPHVSIAGNCFTFIDASGQEAPPMLTFDALIIDISDFMNKRYYDKPYDPNASVAEPPACWSANGTAPSRDAVKPQSATCDLCPHNVRGSATSKLSGTAIKACRDEKWIAIMVPGVFGNMVFQLIVSPGSFTSWKGYINTLQNYKVEPSWVLTRFSFQPKTNGVLMFEMINYADAPSVALADQALLEKKTDIMVGRGDQPRTAALPAPAAAHQTLPPPNQFAQPQQEVLPPVQQGFAASPTQPAQQPIFGTVPGPNGPIEGFLQPGMTPPPGFVPASQPSVQQSPFVPTAAPQGPAPSASGAFGQPTQPATVVSPSEQPAPARRRRRTAAEIAAADAPAPNASPTGQPAPQASFAPANAPQAPFMPQQPAPAQQAAPNNFGIQSGATAPNPEMSAMLAGIFGKPAT